MSKLRYRVLIEKLLHEAEEAAKAIGEMQALGDKVAEMDKQLVMLTCSLHLRQAGAAKRYESITNKLNALLKEMEKNNE